MRPDRRRSSWGTVPRRERPLDAVGSALSRFAADLRALRDKAGGPTYRELGRPAHYSPATLSQAASGQKLPSLAVTLAYVRACGGDAGPWEERWHAVAADEAASEVEVDDEQSPYVGLTAFQPADADRFFGRERLVDALVTRLSGNRMVAVCGASGAGKSSLPWAGRPARAGRRRRRTRRRAHGRRVHPGRPHGPALGRHRPGRPGAPGHPRRPHRPRPLRRAQPPRPAVPEWEWRHATGRGVR